MTKDPLLYRSSGGILYTKALFFELCGSDKSQVLYSLKDEDHTYKGKTYPSLRRLYLELGDETEYTFGETYFLNYPHLLKLTKLDWFMAELEGWRTELRLRSVALGLKVLHQKAQSGDAKAAKELVMRAWDKTTAPGAGRPSKQKIQEEAGKMIREGQEFDEDFARMSSLIN